MRGIVERRAVANGSFLRGEQLGRAGKQRNVAVAKLDQMVDQLARTFARSPADDIDGNILEQMVKHDDLDILGLQRPH